MSMKALASVIKCSIIFERELADLYFMIAERIRFNDIIPVILKHIGRESLNHAETLAEIYRVLNLESDVDCLKFFDLRLKPIHNLRSRIEGVSELSPKDLMEIIPILCDTESLANEEVYGKTIYSLMTLVLNEEAVNVILKEISNEEKYHEELMRILKERVKEVISIKVS